MSKELKADLSLFFVALFWGLSNYAILVCMEEMEPLNTNIFRFLTGFVFVAAVGFGRLKKTNKTTLLYGLAMGVFLTGNYICCNVGLQYTTMSNAGFFCGVACLFVPFLEWIFFKKRPPLKVWIIIFFAALGIMLLSLKGDFTINPATFKGDIISLGTSVCYAGNIIITEKAVSDERTDAYNLGAIQIGVVCIGNTILSFIFETPTVPHSLECVLGILFLGVICSGVAFVVQPIAQQYTTPTKTSLILTLEPVFCAIAAFFLRNERLEPHNYLGMVILLLCIVAIEVDFDPIRGKKKKTI